MSKANEPAFPCAVDVSNCLGNDELGPRGESRFYAGLTKREYFAAMAMQGLLAAWQQHDCMKDPKFVSRDAVEIADALLAELSKNSSTEDAQSSLGETARGPAGSQTISGAANE